MKKLYGDTSFGQVHARCLASSGTAEAPPLVCLHPVPSSGLYFTTVMPLLNAGRDVIAPDYPGYGGSDPLDESPTIADYATAIIEFLDNVGISPPVDVLGFHTGCLVAVEMAHLSPATPGKIALCDVPYFTPEQQLGMPEAFTQPMPLGAELDSLAGPWAFNVGGRLPDVPLERAFELFAEHCRAGIRDCYGFKAAFSYDCVGRFRTLHKDIACLATQSGLHAPTEAAARALPAGLFVDVPEVTGAVFEAGAEAIAKRINESL
jgi:pimeloyl-ACP methyl ester carboxylesterase